MKTSDSFDLILNEETGVNIDLVIENVRKLNVSKEAEKNIEFLVQEYLLTQDSLNKIIQLNSLLTAANRKLQQDFEEYKRRVENNESRIKDLNKKNELLHEEILKEEGKMEGAINTLVSLSDPTDQEGEKKLLRLEMDLGATKQELVHYKNKALQLEQEKNSVLDEYNLFKKKKSEFPQLPQLDKLSQLPELPQLNKLPQLPELPQLDQPFEHLKHANCSGGHPDLLKENSQSSKSDSKFTNRYVVDQLKESSKFSPAFVLGDSFTSKDKSSKSEFKPVLPSSKTLTQLKSPIYDKKSLGLSDETPVYIKKYDQLTLGPGRKK